ncbi:hypothetical protein ACOTV5_02305 [Aliarcobacter butzleri]|uniref:hypothetical protein n=1 Tax=Aliarcobacter butzleri TaxID=28197 RepID=UPI003AFB1389
MNVQILKLLLILSVLLLFSGCSTKEVVYVDRPVEVKVPVKCIVPETHCNFNKETDTEVLFSLRKCIEDLKKNSEVCK